MLTVFLTSPVAGVLFMATAPQVIPSWFRSHSASGQAAWGQATWHGIIHCDHPAKPSSSQSDLRPSGIAPEGSTTHLGLSKARRDRGLHHDRYNHVVSFSFDSPPPTNDESKEPPAPVTDIIRWLRRKHSRRGQLPTAPTHYRRNRNGDNSSGPAARSP